MKKEQDLISRAKKLNIMLIKKDVDEKNSAPLEKEIQNEILDWLSKRSTNGKLLFWRCNNVPVFSRSNDGVKRFRSLPKHTPRGLPDIMIVYQKKFVALEVKRPGGKIRPEQKEFGDKVIENGGHYFIVTSLKEVLDLDILNP